MAPGLLACQAGQQAHGSDTKVHLKKKPSTRRRRLVPVVKPPVWTPVSYAELWICASAPAPPKEHLGRSWFIRLGLCHPNGVSGPSPCLCGHLCENQDTGNVFLFLPFKIIIVSTLKHTEQPDVLAQAHTHSHSPSVCSFQALVGADPVHEPLWASRKKKKTNP